MGGAWEYGDDGMGGAWEYGGDSVGGANLTPSSNSNPNMNRVRTLKK